MDTGQHHFQGFLHAPGRIPGVQPQAGGKAGNHVPAFDNEIAPGRSRIHRANFQFDFFRQSILHLDIQVVFHISGQALVKGLPSQPQGSGADQLPHTEHRSFRGFRPKGHHQAAQGFLYRKARPQSRR